MLNGFERGIVSNLRSIYGKKITMYNDEIVYAAWKTFSQSDEYPDRNEDKFPTWCEN